MMPNRNRSDRRLAGFNNAWRWTTLGVLFLSFGLLCCAFSNLRAQTQEPYSYNLGLFKEEFYQKLKESNYKAAQKYAEEFKEKWEAGYVKNSDKYKIIKQMNALVRKDWPVVPAQLVYMRSVLQIRLSDAQINLDAKQFFGTTDSVINKLPRSRALKYLKILANYTKSGVIYETNNYKWKLTQGNPRLAFETMYDSTEMKQVPTPMLKFSDTDVLYVSETDTTGFKGTSGYLRIFDRKFVGEGGRYDWSRHGLPADTVYCTLKDYQVSLNLTYFKIPDVEFHYKGLIDDPLRGRLEDRIINGQNPKEAEYPKFRSVEGGLTIENFIENVTYEGGFSIEGTTLIGSRTATQLATLHVHRKQDGKEVLKLKGDEFRLNQKELVTDEAQVTLYMPGGDSLYHSSMELVYDVDKQSILLLKDRKSVYARQPITSSYHKYNLYFDAIRWIPNRDTIIFTAFIDKEHKAFAIESYDYWRRNRFEQYRGVLSFNPIGLMYEAWKKTKSREFFMDRFLEYYGLSNQREKLKHAMRDLEGGGFVEYNRKTGKIKLLPRTIKWGAAAAGEKDYDNIQIVSKVKQGYHAALNYQTKKMEMRGVNYFYFTDSNMVDVFPSNEVILVMKNRDLLFGGKMRAGLLNLHGDEPDNFNFQYDNFKVYCDSVDYIEFKPKRIPKVKQGYGSKKLVKALARLKIKEINGAVYINRPNNKSGKEYHPEYPVFDCYSESYKYWNDSTQWNGGVYKKDKMNFTLDPFVLDSLETLDIRDLEFQGKFNCSEIMPSFRDTLKPVRDDTYGLREEMPDKGVPLYNGKGRFFNTVHVDGNAMWGSGRIDYLNTKAYSDSFVFHFDSVYTATYTDSFKLKGGEFKGSEFPQLDINKVKYKWYPKKDELVLETGGEPVKLFNGEGTFRGEIKITPEGVKGDGTLEMGSVQIQSENIEIKERDVEAQDGTFVVADPEIPTKHHFKAEDVAVSYDVDQHTSKFQSNLTGKQTMSFPQQRWTTSLGYGTYDRGAGKLNLKTKSSQSSGTFEAKAPGKKGLGFDADSMSYTLAEEKLDIEGADSILVADAAIFPKKAAVNIDQAGEIEQLKQARILTNLQDRYHTIEDAKVKIQSDLSYTGSGYYEYKGFGGQDTQAIFLADIRVRNRDTTTVATGTIPQDQKFLISNKVFFRDSVELVASRRFLRFSGEVRIQSDNPALRESWFAFADTVNPDSVFIPFKENKKLTVGLHYFTTYRLFYSNFLQERRNPKDDKDILLTRGYLTVDPRTKEFRIGPRDKLQKQQYKGDIVSYDDSTRKITSQGLIKYPFHFGLYNKKNASPATHINLSGRWAQYQSSKNANARLFMRFAIEDFPKNALSALKARADGITSMNEDINVEDRLFQESIAEFTDPRPSLRGVGDKGGLLGNLPVVGKDNKKEKKEDKQEAEDKEQTQKQKEAAMAAPNMKKLVGKIDEMVSVKGFDVGQYVEAELVLANLNATWCDSAKTLYASGPVGLVSVAGKSINKKVSGKIALSQGARLPNGNFRPDTISIYLSLSDGGSEYVFFQIIGNRVKCRSSITAFNSRIQDVADKQKKKDPDKQEGARFEVISNTYLEQFISQFSQFILSGCGDEY